MVARNLKDREIGGFIVCDWDNQRLDFHAAGELGLNTLDDPTALRQEVHRLHQQVSPRADVAVVTIQAKGGTPEVDLIYEREIMGDLPPTER